MKKTISLPLKKQTPLDPSWTFFKDALKFDVLSNANLDAAIRALSQGFTEDRKSKLHPQYLNKKEILKAYTAYYLPLGFEKVSLLLRTHNAFIDDEICDYGSGPGTATLAALFYLKDKNQLKKPLSIKLIDHSEEALHIAKRLILAFASEQKVQIEVETFTKAPAGLKPKFLLASNVLNELTDSTALEKLIEATSGQALVLEPGHRVCSQRLIRLRERVLSFSSPLSILGPCLHKDKCPLFRTKHWCHFSEKVTNDKLIQINKRIFKNPRLWLKFSYLFLSRKDIPASKHLYRAIGDLHMSGPRFQAIDLCKPVEKFALKVPNGAPEGLKRKLVRGAIVEMDLRQNLGEVYDFSQKAMKR